MAVITIMEYTSKSMKVRCYRNRLKRAWGLMFRRPKPVLLVGVNSVHGFFLLEPVWAVFLDDDMRVVDVVLLKPWGFHKEVGARHVLELPVEERPPKKGEVLEIYCD